MPRTPRKEQFRPDEICVVHTVQRCVRRAYLAGKDFQTGRDYGSRREWIRRRMEVLASVYGIDILTYAIMSNHLHLVLRNRPDVVQTWNNRQVAERWLQLFPGKRLDEYLGQPTENEIKTLAKDEKRMVLLRLRLSDISWFMRSLCEPIARMANREDEVTGHFWEGRFKAQRLMDEASLLACSMYVDLNPVRAALAEGPESSLHTSAYDRIEAVRGVEMESAACQLRPLSVSQAGRERRSVSGAELKSRASGRKGHSREGFRGGSRSLIRRDAWLAPLTLKARAKSGEDLASSTSVRASDKGFLEMDLSDYLQLLEWTGRQGRKDKRGKIPEQMLPLLERLGIEEGMWCDLVWNFKRYYGNRAGTPRTLRAEAASNERHWYRGQNAAAKCFHTN